MPAFEVLPYSIDALVSLLAGSHSDPECVPSHSQRSYFEEYFREIGAATILREADYVDRDFLDDFSAYYVRCFHPYGRLCDRLHFFSIPFSVTGFSALLRGETTELTVEKLQKAYLGFIVVKPLPRTVVGRTCLKTYPSDRGRRHFPITRPYEATLFGIKLPIWSLAFQEQDHVVAACATSAVWSAFQGTGMLFHHHIPSPVEITKSAALHTPLERRLIPNEEGLTAAQMAEAIRAVGLEPLHVGAHDLSVLKNTLYSYLCGGIPVLLLIHLIDSVASPPTLLGGHAVAVTGFSLGPPAHASSPAGIILKSSRIDKLYVHDDQVGPFARMAIQADHMTTSFGCGGSISCKAEPKVLLVPLYHKIRILAHQVLEDYLGPFDAFLEALRRADLLNLPEQIEWDLRLCSVNALKSSLQEETTLSGAYRESVLSASLPRFLWRATGSSQEKRQFDLLFDATDIAQGDYFSFLIDYGTPTSFVLKSLGSDPALQNHFKNWKMAGIMKAFSALP